ncbi:putative ankyrin repeat protein [Rosellinia necatrix]|uniref:Putative ankyrin repeat protein n=1 Tax=Rosellinia necatrix TaxID=77044 RepID=A0A1S7UKZ4_ROSNE|nr:putative ankyrin repeat protein [Rosellinia necatrix]
MSDPLSVAGSAVGVISLGIQVAKSLFDYYTALKQQCSDIDHTKHKLDSLLQILQRLHNHINSREFRADEQDLVEQIERYIGECEECIQELGNEADKFKKTSVDSVRSTMTETLRRVAYPLRKSTLVKLNEDVDEITHLIRLSLQLLQQEVMDNIRDEIENVKALLKLVRSSQLSSGLQDWLKAPDATINFNEAHKKKHPRTGLWLVEGKAFETWLSSPNSFLWLRGFAGCGKSVLFSTVVQYAFRHRRSDPQTGVAFFFFTFNDESKQDASAMLRALILQLSVQQRSPDHLSGLHASYRYASPPDESLLGCLHQIIRGFRNVYILIDALDESPRNKHRETTLQTLTDMRSWGELRMHLLVTSRDEVDIRDELQAMAAEVIEMGNDAVDRDIASFVSQNLRENKQLRKWEKYHDQIQETLIGGAKGVFRWVECQFKSLAACAANRHLLNKLLQSLPQSLDETYARMLMNISPELEDYAHQMLTVLCYAVRPLTEWELIDAIAFESYDDPEFNPERRFEDPHALREICPGFTEIDVNPHSGRATVRIAHFSVQEYLESERILLDKEISRFHIRERDGHTHMASICLTLLLEPQLARLDDLRAIKNMHPLVGYAAQRWDMHLARGTVSDRVEARVLRLFQDEKGAFDTWLRVFDPDSLASEFNIRGDPVYYAALLGLPKAVIEQIIDNRPIESPSFESRHARGMYGTALHIASLWGHNGAIEVLLAKGADINAIDSCGGTALHTASSYGRDSTIELLLSKGADINATNDQGRAALYVALLYGRYRAVEILLANGADVNVRDNQGQTALYGAIFQGADRIVEALLANGADVNVTDNQGQTALHEAILQRRHWATKLLLAKGANIDATNNDGDTALHIAVFEKNTEMVEVLLANGADIHTRNNCGITALVQI